MNAAGPGFFYGIAGTLAYVGRAWPGVAAVLPEGHKYERLLVLCGLVLPIGFAAVLAGARRA